MGSKAFLAFLLVLSFFQSNSLMSQGLDESDAVNTEVPELRRNRWEQVRVFEAKFMQASESEVLDVIQDWTAAIHKLEVLASYHVPSESVERIWKYCLKAEPDMLRPSLELFRYVSENDRPSNYSYSLYVLLMEGRFLNNEYVVQRLIAEDISPQIQEDLLRNTAAYVQAPYAKNFEFFLGSLDAEKLYEAVQGLFWEAPDKIGEGLRNEIANHFIKKGSEGLRLRLSNKVLELKSIPSATVLMALLRAPIDQGLKEDLITSTAEKIRTSNRNNGIANSLLFYKELPTSKSSLLNVKISGLFEPALEASADEELDLESRLDFFITGVFPFLNSEVMSEDQYFQTLRLRLPEFVGLDVYSVSSWEIREGLRRWIGRNDRIFSDYYYFTSIFEPARKTVGAKDLLQHYYKAIQGARSIEDLEFKPEIIFESLRSSEFRVRAFAEEICRRMMSDENFDALIEHIQVSDLVSERNFLLPLILDRSRLSKGSYNILMKLMEADDFYGQGAIYYAAQKWANSSEALVKSSLLRWEKAESDRLAQAQLVTQYVFQNSTSEFWKSLGPKEFIAALQKSKIKDSKLSPPTDVLGAILENTKERVQDEKYSWEIRVSTARQTLDYLRYYEDSLNEDLWAKSLDLADWSYDQFCGVAIDETLLFFYRGAKPQFPDEELEIQSKIDELLDSVRIDSK